MKSKQIADFRSKSKEELFNTLKDLEKERSAFLVEKDIKEVKNKRLGKMKRIQIAVIKTILKEKEMEAHE